MKKSIPDCIEAHVAVASREARQGRLRLLLVCANVRADFLEFLLERHDTVENAVSQLLSLRDVPTDRKPVTLIVRQHENMKSQQSKCNRFSLSLTARKFASRLRCGFSGCSRV
jgi:hypothetical protein